MIIEFAIGGVDQNPNSYFGNSTTFNYTLTVEELVKVLRQSAKSGHVIKSLRKFLFDNLFIAEGIDITYDKSTEFHSQHDKSWIDMKVMGNRLGQIQYQDILFTCATRDDPDNKRLYALRDTLITKLFDLDSGTGFKSRIFALFNTDDPSNLIEIGKLWFVRLRQSEVLRYRDQTKYLMVESSLFYEAKF